MIKTQSIPTLEEAYSDTLYGSVADEDRVVEIDPADLTIIDNQPFRAYDDARLAELAESIASAGQSQPCDVRRKDGKLIVLAGRNRTRACALLGRKVRCIVHVCSDEDATLILTDTNLNQRHELLPSEIAYAYKMQAEARQAKGERRTTAAIAAKYGDTARTVQRYIKLAELQRPLLDLVDQKQVAVTAGVDMAALSPATQIAIADHLAKTKKQMKPQQAKKLMAQLMADKEPTPAVIGELLDGKRDEARDIQVPADGQLPLPAAYVRLTERINDGPRYCSASAKEALVQRLGQLEDWYLQQEQGGGSDED